MSTVTFTSCNDKPQTTCGKTLTRTATCYSVPKDAIIGNGWTNANNGAVVVADTFCNSKDTPVYTLRGDTVDRATDGSVPITIPCEPCPVKYAVGVSDWNLPTDSARYNYNTNLARFTAPRR